MSNVLMIRHLPHSLSFKDKEQLLKHFGADKIWETKKKRNYVFAAFPSIEKAQSSLSRLHQLEIAKRRLVVEYSFEKEPLSKATINLEANSVITNHIKDFLQRLTAWNPSVNFYQPPPPHLKYEYPEVSPHIAVNIISALYTHKPLYVQTLHLMNRMSLDLPFNENSVAVEFFKDTFRQYFIDEIAVLPPAAVSDPESEISSDEGGKEKQHLPQLVKRKQTLPVSRKRPAAVLSTATLPKAKKIHVTQEEVFETVTPLVDTKKIAVVVHQDALQKKTEEPEVIGGLGTFQKDDKPEEEQKPQQEEEQPSISKRELLKNRISYSDMKVLPVYKNYHPGQPSMRLYIKNLAKSVTEHDVRRIYKRYVDHIPEEEQIGFDVRVMQEGRMKGQAFVTFPSERIAEKALSETNGYLLKEKPMVVQFARVANQKKT
ncbi:RNA-binding region-containing protein 3 [Aricia agestis]|uniref:RNA-binding region-containing protein 3 n=1 Tax=Aricia agestis TaxID=91739 RepID=UPI001C2040EE|nr:RNA-binding region-containing protein 3 [Aricia agestis]